MYLHLPPAPNPPHSSHPSTSLKPHDSELPSSAPDTQLDREPSGSSDPVQKAAVLQSHQLSPDATIHNQSNSTSKLTMYSLSSLCVLVLAVFLFGSGITATPSLQSIADFIRGKQHEKSPHSSSIYKTRFPHVTWDNSAWKIHNTHLDQGHYQSRIPVANGYLGISVAAVGPFFEVESPVNGDSIGGWPLFEQRFSLATISGFFDSEPQLNATNFEWLNQYGGESAISGVPHWAGLVVDLGDNTYLDASVDSSTISHFSSTLSAKEGVVTWEYTWTPEGRHDLSFQVAYTMFAHKEYVNQGFVQLRIKPSADCDVSIVNVLDGTSAVRSSFVDKGEDDSQIFTAVAPTGLKNITAYIYATMEASAEVDPSTLQLVTDKRYIGNNESSIAQAAKASLKAGKTTVVTKYVGGATSDGFKNPKAVAKTASLRAMRTGFDSSLVCHKAEWASVLPSDSVDTYTFPENGTLPDDAFVIESAITAVLNEYYLLQNTISQNALDNLNNAPIDTNSISVGGLTSDAYGGLVFWDSEIWMQPGLAASHPQAVKQIAKYRAERYGQAKANAQTAYQSSKNDTTFSQDAAIYSWTSGRFGNCTGTGPCFDYQYHINGDIGQEFVNYWVTSGDTEYFKTTLFPIYDSMATFYSELLVKNGSTYTMTNMTDPDEFANAINGGGYSLPLVAETLKIANTFRGLFGLKPNKTWGDQAENIYIPRDAAAGIISEYDGMNGSAAVKQADIVLNTFPLNYQDNYTAEDSRNDLEYYATRQDVNGPGMTWAIYAIVSAEVATAGCASYTYQQYSVVPFARAPFFQFSEQINDDWLTNGKTHPAFPFLTGHGGANQAVIFGYLGLRLTPSFTLHVDPSLPPQIPNLKYRKFYWQGWPIQAIANQTHTTLTRLSKPYETANMTYANASIPVQRGDKGSLYQLPPTGSLVLKNRRPADTAAIDKNIAQCLPISSLDAYVPGQFPLSAVDGEASTKWQPILSNTSQALTVSLASQPFQPISGFYLDFAQTPPVNLTILLHNTSSITSAAVRVTDNYKVVISHPYNETEISIVRRYSSNTTNITLENPVYSGTHATLLIEGNLENRAANATGATVAEWAILGTVGEVLNVGTKERREEKFFDIRRLLRRRPGA